MPRIKEQYEAMRTATKKKFILLQLNYLQKKVLLQLVFRILQTLQESVLDSCTFIIKPKMICLMKLFHMPQQD